MAVRHASDFGNRFALEGGPHVPPGLWLPLSVAGILACGIAVPRLMPALLPAVLVCFALYGCPGCAPPGDFRPPFDNSIYSRGGHRHRERP